MPGKQLIDAGDLVICDAVQNICEPNLRIDAIQFGRFYRFTSTVVKVRIDPMSAFGKAPKQCTFIE